MAPQVEMTDLLPCPNQTWSTSGFSYCSYSSHPGFWRRPAFPLRFPHSFPPILHAPFYISGETLARPDQGLCQQKKFHK